ncbi:transcriptional regulator, TetR family [Klenkia soli]|uniref:Transcriptional regulator, TetR family n=1 Tax=Klenkia soli TaxID=1052260 RepID=A0A1H0FWI7_9ACTN|nr:TetR/AcrR family transcriptional regulator [Klenkia soli]SDN98993.1 transcriptional regulator, TetR family [Klenkia soli]
MGERTLSPEAIVGQALQIIERDGAPALTLRKLGAELGVDATAFYRHFRDKDDLLLACMDRAEMLAWEAVREVPPGATWQQTLLAVADVTWTMATTYPAVYAATFARTTGGPGERRMVEFLLRTLSSAGLDRASTVLSYRAFVEVLLSLSGANATIARLGPEVATKDAEAWARIHATAPSEELPVARAHAVELAGVTSREVFDFAVGAVIDRIAASTGARAD